MTFSVGSANLLVVLENAPGKAAISHRNVLSAHSGVSDGLFFKNTPPGELGLLIVAIIVLVKNSDKKR